MPCVVYNWSHDLTNGLLSPTVVMPMLNYHLDCLYPCDNFDRKIGHHDMQLLYLLLPPILNSIYLLHLLIRLQRCRLYCCCCYSMRLGCLLPIRAACLVDSNRHGDSLNGIYWNFIKTKFKRLAHFINMHIFIKKNWKFGWKKFVIYESNKKSK